MKYTGALTAPEWEDIEPGIVFSFPWQFMNRAHGRKDKFETLCNVNADLSTAPSTSKYTTTGRMSYRRDADVILLVGLTELKAQVGWTDPRTVCPHLILRAV